MTISDSQIKTRIPDKTFGRCPDKGGHEDHAKAGQGQNRSGEQVERLLGEAFCVFIGLQPVGELGHKGCVEGTFGKEAAEQVGQAEGSDKGIKHRTGVVLAISVGSG